MSVDGFKIILMDIKSAFMGVTNDFAIDAASFDPYPITDSSITFEPTPIDG